MWGGFGVEEMVLFFLFLSLTRIPTIAQHFTATGADFFTVLRTGESEFENLGKSEETSPPFPRESCG